MKVECILEKLKHAVNLVEKVSGKNLTLPILGSILIQTDEKGLILRATNLNIGAEIIIPAKITEHGAVAVSAQLLTQICNGLNGDVPVVLSLINENLIIQTKTSKMTLKSMSIEDFPTLPKISEGDHAEFPVDVFTLGVKSVYYAAAISDIKPEIASIYIYSEDNHLVFVATDAFRLAEKKIKISQNINLPELLIPAKYAVEITRIIQDFSGNLQVIVGENQISFSVENMYITSRLTGGSYPNYRQIMPKESKTEMVVLKSDVVSLVKTLMVFSDKFNQIDLVLNPGENQCVVTCHNQDTGEGIVTLQAAISGNPLETRINHRYLTDALQSITTDSLSLSFTEPNKPMIVKGIGDTSFTYLVMPMNR
jgi:DNA polymerase-3 subunit beta